MTRIPANHTVEAHGVKGMKNTAWRKTFTTTDALCEWCERNDAEVYGTRDLERAALGNLCATPFFARTNYTA